MRPTRRLKALLAFGAAGIAILAVVAVASGIMQPDEVELPIIKPRTPIPGADKGGLFADGVQNLPRADTSGWKTYSNDKYTYSFKYPPNWELEETDSAGLTDPQGRPAYPLQAATVKNPFAERGQNQPGVNCVDAACIAPLPKALGFYVAIESGHCGVSGDLVVADTFTVDGRQGDRCVIESPNDKVSRVVHISFPLGDGKNFLKIAFERGRNVSPGEQGPLETILSTFKFTRGTGP